jgi:hypothetical protein
MTLAQTTPPTCDPGAVLDRESTPLLRAALGGEIRSCGRRVRVTRDQQCENTPTSTCDFDPNRTQIVFDVQWTHGADSVVLAGSASYWTHWPSVVARTRGNYKTFELTETSEHYGGSREKTYLVVAGDRVVLREMVQECSNSGARWECGPQARVRWTSDHTLQIRSRDETRSVDLRVSPSSELR